MDIYIRVVAVVAVVMGVVVVVVAIAIFYWRGKRDGEKTVTGFESNSLFVV